MLARYKECSHMLNTYRSVFDLEKKEPTYTNFTHKFEAVIDYILYSP